MKYRVNGDLTVEKIVEIDFTKKNKKNKAKDNHDCPKCGHKTLLVYTGFDNCYKEMCEYCGEVIKNYKGR